MEGENTEQQHAKQFDWLKAYQWQKGQSGNPGGRPKGKSLKTFTREFLESMNEEDRIEYLKTIDPAIVWRMAEGNPHQSGELDIELNPRPLLDVLRNNDSSKEDKQANEAN